MTVVSWGCGEKSQRGGEDEGDSGSGLGEEGEKSRRGRYLLISKKNKIRN